MDFNFNKKNLKKNEGLIHAFKFRGLVPTAFQLQENILKGKGVCPCMHAKYSWH